jgi:hypothetical protein
MANRFNQYMKVNYVGLPMDAYQMAAGSIEQENLMNLQSAKSIYDGMQDIEASYNPDLQLKGELLKGVQDQIAALSTKNMKGADTLMAINKIVNNRGVIDKLANIHANTVNYKAALAAEKKYQEDSGNDINIQRGIDERAAYNEQDSKGFKAGMMAGYQPSKFMDMVGDAQKVLKDSKGNSYEKVWSNGRYIYKSGHDELSEEELIKKALPLFNDPKYTSQLANLNYYTLKKYGNTPQEGIKNYNDNYVKSINSQISDIASKLSEYQKLVKNNPGKGYEKLIEKGNNAIGELSRERDETMQDNSGAVFSRNMREGLAKSALSPFTYTKDTISQAVDPFALAGYKADRAFGSWAKKHQIERKEEIERNPVTPIIGTVQLTDGTGAATTQAAALISKDGGFNMGNLSETVSYLAQSVPTLLDENSQPVNISISDKKKLASNIKAAVNSGDAVLSYLPGKKEYMVSMADGKKYRMPADLNMQQAMDPLYQMHGTDPINGRGQAEVSLDGKTLSTVYMTRQQGEQGSHLFVPISDPYNIKKLSNADISKLTGIDMSGYDNGTVLMPDGKGGEMKVPAKSIDVNVFSTAESLLPGQKIGKDDLTNASNSSVFVLVEGQFPDKNDGKGTKTLTYKFSPKRLEDAKAMGFVETGNHVIYTQDGGNIEFLRGLDGGPANSNIIQSHMRYNSQPGGRLNLLKTKDAQKTKKVSASETDTESGSEDETDNNVPL